VGVLGLLDHRIDSSCRHGKGERIELPVGGRLSILFPRIYFPRIVRTRIALLIAVGMVIFAGSFASAQQKQPEQNGPPAQEAEKKDAPLRRIEWFYNQRAYPFGRIPPDARLKALRQLDDMLVRQGKLVRRPDGTVAVPAEAAAAAAGANPWTPIGPQPTDSRFFGLTSGRVTALAVDPTDANTAYLGGAQGGIWKTTDGGANWTPLTDDQASLAIGSLAIDPNSCSPGPCKIIYAGTGEENFSVDSYYGAGVLKSSDAGNTWTRLGAGVFVGPFSGGFSPGGGARIGAFAVHPTNSQILLAGVQIFLSADTGTSSGIYRSTDGGSTWTQVLSGAAGVEVLFDPTNGNVAYAALGTTGGDPQNGVYRSTDGGQSWSRVTNTGNVLPTGTALGRIALAIAPSTPSTLYASIQDPRSATFGSLLGMFKTTDGGTTWSKLTVPDYCRDQCWYDNFVRVSPTSASIVFVGGSAASTGFLLRSTDGGNNWSDFSSGGGVLLHVDQHALAFSAGGSRLYVGNDGGAYRTDNPTAVSISWLNLNSTLNITQFYPGHSIHPSSQFIGFGGTQDNGTQKFTGSPLWTELTCGDGGWTAIDPSVPSTVYAACQNIDVRKSVFDGNRNTFFPSDSGITQTDRSAFIPPMVIDPSTPQRLYFGTFRVYQTTNGASSWTAVANDLTGTGSGSSGPDVSTIAVAPSNSNVVYAGTDNGRVAVCQTAGSAAPGCWQDVGTGLPNRAVTQTAVDASDTSGHTAYVTFSGFSGCTGCDNLGHIFKTINAGAAWLPISGNLPDTPVNDIVIDPDVPNTLYVGTDIGVFVTNDGGLTWSPMSTASPGVPGLPRVTVLSLKLREPSRTLRAATHGRGVWDFQLGNLTAFNLSSISPTSKPSGSAGFTLTVNGNGFTQSPLSTVKWNGAAQPTTFVTGNQLTANIPASLLTNPGTPQITVDQSGGSGPISNALVFSITGAAPTLNSVVLSSAAAGSGNTSITLNGLNFASNAQVFWNGSPNGVTTNPGGTSTQLTAMLSSSLLTFGGVNTITVVNPPPGGGPSNGLAFTVTAPAPPNDSFLNAISVTGNGFSDTKDSSGATTDTGGIADPTPPTSGPNSCFTDTTGLVNNGKAKSIWYKFTPGSTVSVTADTVGSAYDTILSVWSGSQGNLTSVACNDDIKPGIVTESRVTFNANGGTTYFFMITAFSGDGGKSVFNVSTSAAAADFSLSASPASATVSPGGSATYTITVTPQGGFSGTVTLACTNPPAVITCSSFSPPSVTPPNSTSTVTLTASASAVVPRAPSFRQGPRLAPWLVVLALAIFTAGLLARRTQRRRLALELSLVVLFLLLLLKVAGCGGGGGGGTPPGPRTYTVTVTGTSGSTPAHTTTLTLVVQ